MTVIISYIAAALSLTAIVLSLKALSKGEKPSMEAWTRLDTQYVMYLGTNDKDTNEPVFSPEESVERAKAILINYFGGYTIQPASGGWIDDGKLYQEYTIVIYLSNTDIDRVHKAADRLIKEFRQSSVLIQADQTITEFYAG